MAATKIPKGIELITQFVRGQFAKRSAKKTGIAGLKKASDSIVQSNVRSIEIILKNMGIDPNYLKSTDDVLKHMNIHKAMMNQHLRQQFGTLNLDKGIKSLEKKQPFQGFNPRVQQDVNSIIKDLKNMEPVAAMKEANLIIGRKGKYKNLSGDESQRILKETDDHIFQRDIKYDEFGEPIKPDPEDMASGGRTGYAVGKLVKGGKWFLNSLYDTKKQLMQLDIPLSQKKELMKQADDAIKHIEGGGPIPEQIIQHIRKDPKFKSVSQGTRSGDPDLAEMEEVILEYGKKHAEGGRIEMGAGGIMKLLKGLLKKKPKPKREKIYGVGGKEIDVAALKKKHGLDPETLKKDEEAFNLRLQQILAKHSTKHADGGRIGMMYGGDPGFAFEYGGSWADWHDQHRDQMPVEQYIKTKLPKHRLPFRELQSGGLAYMLGEPTYMKYGAGGSVGHAPWHKPTGQQQPQGPEETPIPQVAGTPDPLKAPRGIPSVAPKNMDPAHMQQQMMKKAMMGQQRPRMEEGGMIPEQFLEDLKRRNYHEFLDKYHRWKEDYERKKDLAPTQEAAGGGRIGFGLGGIDKGRRAFMKWLAGITGAGIAAGTGLLKLGKAAKIAKPAAAVTETIIKSNAPGMPSWFPLLVKRVLKEGKDETAKLATIERQTVHTAKTPEGTPIQVTRDLVTDDVIVDIGEQTKHGWPSGRHGQPVQLQLKKGEWIEPTKKGKKGIKTKDEFTVDEAEFTGGHPENVKFEESVQFKYGEHGSDFSEIEQFATKSPVTSGSSHGEVSRSLKREGWYGKKEKELQLKLDKKHGGLKSTYKKDPHVRGKQADLDDWAEGRAESAAEDVDFAKGGLAYLLGE